MIKRAGRFLKRMLQFLFWLFFLFVPVKQNKIFVSNYCGKGYGDNPKYIVEELLKSGECLEIIWSTKSKGTNALPEGVRYCSAGSFTEIFHLATSKVWIDNCRKHFAIKKHNQKYLQTWHGFALKRIERDAEAVLSKSYIRSAKKDSRNIDIIISDSTDMTKVYRNSFWYNGEIAEWGAPRNDILSQVNNDIVEKVKKFYNISTYKKIILYAPTFRKNNTLDAYLNEFDSIVKACKTRFGHDYAVLVRLHPNISGQFKKLSLSEKIVDASDYPDLQELLLATDLLISDYSSLMFDYMITKKPCFIYAPDICDYKNDRNFYFDIKTVPFSISESGEQLVDFILNFNSAEYEKDIERFIKEHGIIYMKESSKRCVNWILSNIRKDCEKR